MPDNAPTLTTYPDGTREWLLNGQLHRVDGPAIERPDGTRQWWLNGKRHRADGPAYEHPDGTREWWLDGKRHRADGPAYEDADGTREWYLDGKRQPDPQQVKADATTDAATKLARRLREEAGSCDWAEGECDFPANKAEYQHKANDLRHAARAVELLAQWETARSVLNMMRETQTYDAACALLREIAGEARDG